MSTTRFHRYPQSNSTRSHIQRPSTSTTYAHKHTWKSTRFHEALWEPRKLAGTPRAFPTKLGVHFVRAQHMRCGHGVVSVQMWPRLYVGALRVVTRGPTCIRGRDTHAHVALWERVCAHMLCVRAHDALWTATCLCGSGWTYVDAILCACVWVHA